MKDYASRGLWGIQFLQVFVKWITKIWCFGEPPTLLPLWHECFGKIYFDPGKNENMLPYTFKVCVLSRHKIVEK